MSNPVIEVMKSRSSIRAYASQALSEAEISTLKEAALSSPTAKNLQTQRYYFITSAELNQEIEQATVQALANDQVMTKHLAGRQNKVLYNAPLFIAIAIDPQNIYGKIDAGIAVQNLALAAKSLGLESVILGLPAAAFADPALKAKVGFPAGHEYGVGIAIGHGAMTKEPHNWDYSHIIEVK